MGGFFSLETQCSCYLIVYNFHEEEHHSPKYSAGTDPCFVHSVPQPFTSKICYNLMRDTMCHIFKWWLKNGGCARYRTIVVLGQCQTCQDVAEIYFCNLTILEMVSFEYNLGRIFRSTHVRIGSMNGSRCKENLQLTLQRNWRKSTGLLCKCSVGSRSLRNLRYWCTGLGGR